MPRRRATTAETIAIHKLLTEHLQVFDNGCIYTAGVSDQDIAALVAEDLPETCVARIRREMFGNFIPQGPTDRVDALATQVLALTLAFNQLAGELGSGLRVRNAG